MRKLTIALAALVLGAFAVPTLAEAAPDGSALCAKKHGKRHHGKKKAGASKGASSTPPNL